MIPVTSMEAIVKKLAGLKSVQHVRIVTHGWVESEEQAMELPLFEAGKGRPAAGATGIDRENLQLAKPGVYVAQVLEELLADRNAPDALRGSTRLVSTNPPEPSMGASISEQTKESAKAAGLMQDQKQDYHTHFYEWSSERTVVASLAVLALIHHYRALKQQSMKVSDLEFLENTFVELKQSALARSEAPKRAELEEFRGNVENDASTFASAVRDPGAILGQLLANFRGRLARVRDEAEGDTVADTFFHDLARAREALAPGAEIEIRGCNIGRDQVLMDRLQGMFSIPGERAPTVSAPTLFQVFTRMAVSSFRSEDPAAPPPKAGSRVSLLTRRDEALAENRILVNMSPEARKLGEVLKDFYRGEMARLSEEKASQRRNQLFPRARIAKYNPGLNLDAIPPFGVVWLRAAPESERNAMEGKKEASTELVDELRGDSSAESLPPRGLETYSNRTDQYHELLARQGVGSRPTEDPKLAAAVREWVWRFLGEKMQGSVKDHLWVTFLTAHSNLPMARSREDASAGMNLNGNQDLVKGDPILYPGQAQFWRHINVTRGRG